MTILAAKPWIGRSRRCGKAVEVVRHQNVIGVAAVKQELVSQDALDDEPAGLVQPSSSHVVAQHLKA